MKRQTSDSNAGTYDNLKKWGDSAQAGDVFIVSATDVGQNGAVGDYFIAQFDGPSSDHPFPDYGENDAYWKHAWSTTLIELITESGLDGGAIYSNGLNQIGILVFITAVDPNKNDVPLSQDVLDRVKSTLQLIDYTSGDALPQGWSFTDQENEFHHLPQAMESAPHSSDPDKSVDKSKFKLYLSCSPTSTVTPLKVGAQLTMANGKTAASSLMDPTDHSFVAIETLPPKRYDLSNTAVDTIRLDDVYVITRASWSVPYRQYANYLRVTDYGFYILKYDLTKGVTVSDTWMQMSHDRKIPPTDCASYIWNRSPNNQFAFIIVDYKDDDRNDPMWSLVELEYGGRDDVVAIYYLVNAALASGFSYSSGDPSPVLADTQITIWDQFGNSSLFTVVSNGKNGLLSLKVGANSSWDPTGTGTFPTLTK
ncbi:hypothetical protein PHO31112_04719 [Pandoraea horticolens]|uniref:Uncharacterized protein n=1 Tax=Pandoraea horticolens TaxID=2508298 RepID=A0A5E4YRK8_9BURK|nr:hypothetical protein [Pandoraea horticolens]VVE51459.1 hypothetical protein PHO31112_04719 [Pandoraea horticolens]